MDTICKSGIIGIVGPTNAGKSTLLNSLLGKKLSIVSKKPQTTLHPVRGVYHGDEYQLVFTDTPGLGGSRNRKEPLLKWLNRSVDKQVRTCDSVMWIFDASKSNVMGLIREYVKYSEQWVKDRPPVCILNKVDVINKLELLPLIAEISSLKVFRDIIPISAKTGQGVPELRAFLKDEARTDVKYFDKDQWTDRKREFIVSELVREQIFNQMHAEIPYSVWVEVEQWFTKEEAESKCPAIHVTVHVESPSKKAMIIGRGGMRLKEIGTRARSEIEKYLGHRVFLKLRVDVHEHWKSDPRHISKYLELQ